MPTKKCLGSRKNIKKNNKIEGKKRRKLQERKKTNIYR